MGGFSSRGKRNVFRNAFPAAVSFTEASWKRTQPAEVDASAAHLINGKLQSVDFTSARKRRSRTTDGNWSRTSPRRRFQWMRLRKEGRPNRDFWFKIRCHDDTFKKSLHV